MEPSSTTTLHPLMFHLLASFALITSSTWGTGSKPQILLFFLNFSIALLVFMAGVGEARVVPSPWPARAIVGTGPLCLRGTPPCGYYYI